MSEEEAQKVVQNVLDEVDDGWTARLMGDYVEGRWRFHKGTKQIEAQIPLRFINDGEHHQIEALIRGVFAREPTPESLRPFVGIAIAVFLT